ncbi:nucleoplasmin-3 [Spea bombifrons]|uniref:nucleoplasmin-3 n=1 Tax=Spea bombifrons TaxID=233779 RepID=UPI002349215B|nr:nucleoplasmin-3 [Spea bombifrons]
MSSLMDESVEDMPQPAMDSFLFGCELSSKSRQYTFQVDEDDDCEHTFCLHTITLGGEAKDENNVVEVVGRNHEDKEVAVQVANLKLSCQTMVNVDNFELQPPVTFRLKSGSGPVLLSGRHVIVTSEDQIDSEEEDDEDDDEDDDDDDDEEMEDEDDDDEEITPIKPANKKMRK